MNLEELIAVNYQPDEVLYMDDKPKDGVIDVDSQFARKLGFTSDLFSGYLFLEGESIWVSFIQSKKESKGNFTKLLDKIYDLGYKTRVPTPFPRMKEILTWKGFEKRSCVYPKVGEIEVWIRDKK